MSISLKHVASEYLQDRSYHSQWKNRIQMRKEDRPHLQRSLQTFINNQRTLTGLRNDLEYYMRKAAWDSSNKKNSREWLLAELTILIKYHGAPAETGLRQALTDLNSRTVGEKIGFFHDFLISERERISEILQYVPDIEKSVKKKEIGRPMAPLNSALMISLFASTLDSRAYFCDIYVRRAIHILRSAGLTPLDKRIDYDQTVGAIEIRSFAHYQYVVRVFDEILKEVPALRVNDAWSEIFTRWIVENVQVIER